MPRKDAAGRKMASRIRQIMAHTVRYSIDGRMRLIADTGLSESVVTRLLNGNCSPMFWVVLAVIEALEKALGRTLDSREILSFSGRFPTDTVCELVQCRGCPECKPFAALGTIPGGVGEEPPRSLQDCQLTIPTEEYD